MLRSWRLGTLIAVGLAVLLSARVGHAVLLEDNPGGNTSARVDYLEAPGGGAKNPVGFSKLESTVTASDGSMLTIPTLTEWTWYIRKNNGVERGLDQHNVLMGAAVSDRDGDPGNEFVEAQYQDPDGAIYTLDFEGELVAPGVGQPGGLAGLTNTLRLNHTVAQPTNTLYDIFFYADFDIFEPTGETVEWDPMQLAYIQNEDFVPPIPFDPATTFLTSVTILLGGGNTVAREASAFSDLRDVLRDGVAGNVALNNADSVPNSEAVDPVLAFQFQFEVPAEFTGNFSATFSQEPIVIETPEPGAALILGISLAALGYVRRRPRQP